MNKTRRLFPVISFIVLVLIALFTLFPIYMAVVNSFKEQSEMFQSAISFPKVFTLKNYTESFQKVDIPRGVFNTAIVTAIGLAGILGLGSLAGYKLSRTDTKLSKFLYAFMICSMMIPFHSIMITLLKVANVLNIQNTKHGLGFIYIGLGIPMAVFLYHGFVKSIPAEIEESATVDGCGQLQCFVRIVLPLLKPITATIAILNFLWMWNDFFLPMLVLGTFKNYTLVLSSYMFFDKYNTDWSNVLATLVVTTLPVVAFYFLFQKYIINGITAGAVKG